MFIGKALHYSLYVSLRMIPILAITLYSAFMLFYAFVEHPLVILLICGTVYFPALVFLYINALRCGLMALRATGAPLVKRFWPAMLQFMRFNLAITNLFIGLVGIGGSALFMHFVTPDVWLALKQNFTLSSLGELQEFLGAVGHIPLAVIPFLALALSLGIATTGTSAAATANSVGVGAPKHDMIWGATRQWRPLLTLSLLILVAPALALVFAFGGPLAGLSAVFGASGYTILSMALYLLWAICCLCAGQAIAYVKTIEENEQLRAQEQTDLTGPELATDDLRAIRHQRMENSKLATD